MSPVGEQVEGSNCGNVFLAVRHAGYYTHLEESFMAQFCCGTGDCAKAGVQGLRRRDVSEIPELIARAAAGELGDETFAVPLVSFQQCARTENAQVTISSSSRCRTDQSLLRHLCQSQTFQIRFSLH